MGSLMIIRMREVTVTEVTVTKDTNDKATRITFPLCPDISYCAGSCRDSSSSRLTRVNSCAQRSSNAHRPFSGEANHPNPGGVRTSSGGPDCGRNAGGGDPRSVWTKDKHQGRKIPS